MSPIRPEKDFSLIIDIVLDDLPSRHSKIAYRKALVDFLEWNDGQGKPKLDKAMVERYKTYLTNKPVWDNKSRSVASINLRLSAIRKFMSKAAEQGLISSSIADEIVKIECLKRSTDYPDNSFTRDDVIKLVRAPNIKTLEGLRDRAILALAVSGGFKQADISALVIEQMQLHDGQWIIANIIGKRNRMRSVPIKPWIKKTIDEWTYAANITKGNLFRALRKGLRNSSEQLSNQSINDVVRKYAELCGYNLPIHDLLCIFSSLAAEDEIEIS
jgi:site-specific recombinase XerD